MWERMQGRQRAHLVVVCLLPASSRELQCEHMNKFRPCSVVGLQLLQDMSRSMQLQQLCCHHRGLHLHLQRHLGLWHALSLLHRIGSPTAKWLPHCENLFIKFTLNFHVEHERERSPSTLLSISPPRPKLSVIHQTICFTGSRCCCD